MNHVVIFCAIPPEMAAFTSAMPTEDAGLVGVFPRRTGQIAERRISLVLCGMGKVHAAAAAQAAIAQLAPDALLSCGTAGGLDPQLAVGDVVIGATAIQHDYGFVTPDAFIPFGLYIAPAQGRREYVRAFPADPTLLAAASACAEQPSASPNIVTGAILTGDQVIFSAAKRRALREEFAASAVDMESAAIAQVCAMHRLPFLSVRAISDYADESANLDLSRLDPNELAEFSAAPFGKKLGVLAKTLRYVAQHPSAFAASLQMRQRMNLASARAAGVVMQLLARL